MTTTTVPITFFFFFLSSCVCQLLQQALSLSFGILQTCRVLFFFFFFFAAWAWARINCRVIGNGCAAAGNMCVRLTAPHEKSSFNFRRAIGTPSAPLHLQIEPSSSSPAHVSFFYFSSFLKKNIHCFFSLSFA